MEFKVSLTFRQTVDRSMRNTAASAALLLRLETSAFTVLG